MAVTGSGNMQFLVQLMQGEATEMKIIDFTHHHNGNPGRRLLAPRVSAARLT